MWPGEYDDDDYYDDDDDYFDEILEAEEMVDLMRGDVVGAMEIELIRDIF